MARTYRLYATNGTYLGDFDAEDILAVLGVDTDTPVTLTPDNGPSVTVERAR